MAVHGLPTQHLLSKTFEDLAHQRLGQMISNHILGVTFDNFNDTAFHMGPEVMQLYSEILVPIVQMLRVCQE